MKKHLPFLIVCLFSIFLWSGKAGAQNEQLEKLKSDRDYINKFSKNGWLRPLTEEDIKKLDAIPELKLRSSKALPARVNNAELKYFRSIFNQTGNCCGQASGVAYNFTYEMNLLNNTEANTPETTFPSHYTWTLLNKGKENGSWYFDGWDKIIENGCPTIADYGSIDANGDNTYWMSGYNKYYRGMKNRVKDYKTINVSTVEGINTLKQWIYDHGRGDEHGGLANFAAYMEDYATTELTNASSDAGKKVLLNWGDDYSSSHAMTIVGYDDDIKVDINGDGKFTNDIDINTDGVIDLKDNECGAFIVANSWGDQWLNDGFVYMPYRLCAFDAAGGGVAYRQVHVLNVENKTDIRYTMKVVMSYSNRSNLTYRYGFHKDLESTGPSSMIRSELMKYAGGDWPLGGKKTDDNDIFILGLDIDKVESIMQDSESGKFYLSFYVSEGEGTVYSISVFDHENENPEFISDQIDIPITKHEWMHVPITYYPTETKRIVVPSVANETEENDGSVESLKIGLANLNFSKENGLLQSGVDFTVENLPEGLSVELDVLNAKEAELKFNGKAIAHFSESDVKNLKLKFNQSAFDVADLNDIKGLESNIIIDFDDQPGIVIVNLNDVEVSKSHDWEPLNLMFGNSTFGGWYSNGALRFETYTKALVCEGTSRNISLLESGTLIGSESNWVAGGAFPDEHNIRTEEYTAWDGKHGYIGFQIPSGDVVHYGWFEITVSDNGDSYILHRAAYNEQAGEAIPAGESLIPMLINKSGAISENPKGNAGVITEKLKLEILSGEFALENGTKLTEGEHFSSANIPDGISIEAAVIDNKNIEVSFMGQATAHEEANSVKNAVIEFADVIFKDLIAGQVLESSQKFDINFIDAYKLIHENFEDIITNAGSPWNFFRLDNNTNAEFGGYYENGGFYIETYTKEALCSGKDNMNLSLLETGTIINSSSEFWNPSASGNYHIIHNSKFKSWDGKEGYVGISLKDKAGNPCYGWLKVGMNADGTEMTIMEAAYQEGPRLAIIAGSTESSSEPQIQAEGVFVEPFTNDGSLEGEGLIYIFQGTFRPEAGTVLEEGADFAVTNLPEGLSVELVVKNQMEIEATISGTAVNNTKQDNCTFAIEFRSKVLNNASDYSNKTVYLDIEFKGPFEIIYTDIDDIVASSDSKWTWFYMGVGTEALGAWWHGKKDTLTFETYGNMVVGYENTTHIKALEAGELIGETSTDWIKKEHKKAYLNLQTANYSDWKGKEAYVGVALSTGEFTYYGWLRIEVNSSGTQYTVKDYAYNEQPNAPLRAGQKTKNSAPTDITLSNNQISNNAEIGGLAGIFTTVDEDENDLYTYTLISGDGQNDINNNLFKIQHDSLIVNGDVSALSLSELKIYVESIDVLGESIKKAFVINVVNNNAPSDISLDNTELKKSSEVGAIIAKISVTDADTDDTHTYKLITGDGANDSENSYFTTDGSSLLLAKEVGDLKQLHIYLEATDKAGDSYAKAFVLDVNTTDISDLADADIIISPNPFIEYINIDGEGIKDVEIYSRSGLLIKKIKATNGEALKIYLDAEPGIYFIKLSFANGRTVTKKIMKI